MVIYLQPLQPDGKETVIDNIALCRLVYQFQKISTFLVLHRTHLDTLTHTHLPGDTVRRRGIHRQMDPPRHVWRHLLRHLVRIPPPPQPPRLREAVFLRLQLLQAYCTCGHRNGDWLDFAANSLGVLLGALIGLLLYHLWFKARR